MQQTGDAWRSIGLEPIPSAAPPYRVIGSMGTQAWVAWYHPEKWDIRRVDDRFTVDVSVIPLPIGQGRLRRGDVLVLVGEASEYDWEEERSEPSVWAPGMVLEARSHSSGWLRVESLRDALYETPSLADLRAHAPRWSDELKKAGNGATVAVDRTILGLWGLDVWCPACGALGTRLLWGMPDGPPSARYDDGSLKPWPLSDIDLGGCVIDNDAHPFACGRCGTTWGSERQVVDYPAWDAGEWPGASTSR